MSQKERELELQFQQILTDMLDDEASEVDIQRLLNEANQPAMLSLWRRYHRQRAALTGQHWLADTASTDFLKVLKQRIAKTEIEFEAKDQPVAPIKAQWFGVAAFSWFGGLTSLAAVASLVGVVFLTVSLMENYSPTSSDFIAVFSLIDSATDETPANQTFAAKKTAEADAEHFIQQRVSAYTLNHANNRVVSTHFVPFTKMSTYQTSWAGLAGHSEEERYVPARYDRR